MKLEEIENEWSKDSKIDKLSLDEESLKIPELHNKYYKIYIREKIQLKKLKSDLDELIKLKKDYYDGRLSKEELNEYGWQPFNLTILKSEMDTYLNADVDLINKKLKCAAQSEKVDFLHSIIDSVSKRTFVIKNAIEFLRFTNGGF